MFKRTLSLLLALLTLTAVLAACAAPDIGETGESDTVPVTDSTRYHADIPEGTNYAGETFNIYTYPDSSVDATWYDVDFSAEGEDGTTINDAAYIRMRYVEDTLGVDIVAFPNSNSGAELKTSIAADDHAFDVAFISPRTSATMAQDGQLLDLYGIPELDLENPWWDSNAVNDLSVANRLYMVTGDISVMYKKTISVLLFNKQLIDDYKLESPYSLVLNNTWTLDAFNDMVKAVSVDINNNSTPDQEDSFGLLYYCNMMATSLIGSGAKFITKDSEDLPALSLYTDRTVAVFDKLADILYDADTAFSWSKSKISNNDVIAMFMDNRGLFNFNEFHAIENMRKMDTEFGILPTPMFDETQERYYHTINPHVAAMLTVPVYNNDTEKTAYILESLGAASKNDLTPAYYEVYLKQKGARDDESKEMLDIIFDTMTYDLGYICDWGGIGQFTLTMADSYNENFSSQYDSLSTAAERAMDKAVDLFLAVD